MLSIKKLDIFTVDPVHLHRDKRKTRTFFGTFLTILLSSLTVTLFIILYARNENKAPLVSQEVTTTSNLKQSIQASIEWNSEFVDVDSVQPFFLINNGENTDCFRSIDIDTEITKTNIKLCNYLQDEKNEPNGIGYVFKYKINHALSQAHYNDFRQRKFLPFENSDSIIMVKDNFVYIIQAIKSQFCLVNIVDQTFDCYPITIDTSLRDGAYYLFFDAPFLGYCFSIFDNKDKAFLFVNHKLNKEYTLINPMRSSYDYYFFFLLNEEIVIEVFESSYKFTSMKNASFVHLFDYTKHYNDDNYIPGYIFISTYHNPLNASQAIFLYTDVQLVKETNHTLAFFANRVTIKNSEIFETINYTLSYNVPVNIDRKRVERIDECNVFYDDTIEVFNKGNVSYKNITRYFYIIGEEVVYYTATSNNFSNIPQIAKSCQISSVYPATEDYKREVLYIGENLFIMYDYFLENNLKKLEKMIFVDKYCNIDTYTQEIYPYGTYHEFSYKEIKYISKNLTSFTYYFYLDKYSYKRSNTKTGFGSTLWYPGPVLEVTIKNNIANVKPLFTNTFRTLELVDDTSNEKVASIKILNQNQNEISINYEDILPMVNEKNDLQVKVQTVGKQNDQWMKKQAYVSKTLYTYTVPNNQELLNSMSSNDKKFYYSLDNTNSGNQKKFSCLFPLQDKQSQGIKKFKKNSLNCLDYNLIGVPFLFDNSYFIKYGDGFYEYSNDETYFTGIFLITLDDFFYETKTSSTQDSILNIFGVVCGVFSTLISIFAFVKNLKWKFDHRKEINEKEDKKQPEVQFSVKV